MLLRDTSYSTNYCSGIILKILPLAPLFRRPCSLIRTITPTHLHSHPHTTHTHTHIHMYPHTNTLIPTLQRGQNHIQLLMKTSTQMSTKTMSPQTLLACTLLSGCCFNFCSVEVRHHGHIMMQSYCNEHVFTKGTCCHCGVVIVEVSMEYRMLVFLK